MKPWHKKSSLVFGTRYVTQLEPIEREMLGNSAATVSDRLMERVRTAPKDELAELTGMSSGHEEAPQDPGLRRILPNFFRDGDEEVEGEAGLMRQLNETDIIKEKLISLRFICDTIGPDGSVNVTVSESEVRRWLNAITDIRNFHYAEVEYHQLTGDMTDEQIQAAKNYVDWLGYHQDTLLEAIMGKFDF